MSEEKKIEELTEEELSKMTGGAWPDDVWAALQAEISKGADPTETYNFYIRKYGSPWTGK